jgi:flagellar assembly factor FliW
MEKVKFHAVMMEQLFAVSMMMNNPKTVKTDYGFHLVGKLVINI